jgi:hypothetical protein
MAPRDYEMTPTMTFLIRLVLLVLLLLQACFSEVRASGAIKAEIEVFRAFPVFDSEGSRRLARSKLGCDPCTEVVDERDEDHSRYFLNPAAGIHLNANAIESVGVETSGQGAVVFVVLSEYGKSVIETLVITSGDFAANVVNGKVIGLVPLRLFESRYVVAFAPTQSAAEEIAQLLR